MALSFLAKMKKISKILRIFSPNNRGFLGGQPWTVRKPYNIEGLLFEKNRIFNEVGKK